MHIIVDRQAPPARQRNRQQQAGEQQPRQRTARQLRQIVPALHHGQPTRCARARTLQPARQHQQHGKIAGQQTEGTKRRDLAQGDETGKGHGQIRKQGCEHGQCQRPQQIAHRLLRLPAFTAGRVQGEIVQRVVAGYADQRGAEHIGQHMHMRKQQQCQRRAAEQRSGDHEQHDRQHGQTPEHQPEQAQHQHGRQRADARQILFGAGARVHGMHQCAAPA